MMGHAVSTENREPRKFERSDQGKWILLSLVGLGVMGLALGYVVDQKRMWHAYLSGYFYFSSLCLCALFFVAVQHVSHAGWSVNIRRIPESMVAFLPVVGLGGLVLLGAGSHLYSWLDPEVVAKDSILQGKASYLNFGFWAFRLVVFCGLWWFFARKIVGYSVAQDGDGDESWTRRLPPLSVAFILVFALSFSLYTVDLLMSLEPHWFSTIFGVYCFSGAIQASLAAMILMTLYCRSKGWVTGLMTIEHVHDLAKFMKGFTVFWAYIAFSQFMLIWYANLPEETIYYLHRSHGGWMAVSVSLLIFKFVIPFLALLPRWAKRTPSHLIMVSVLVLVMHYVDVFWMVYPNYSSEFVAFSWMEILVFLGFLGGFLFMVTGWLGKHNLVPIKDPRRGESLAHHVLY